MEILGSFVTGVVSKFGELLVEPIVKQCEHLIHPNKSINNLKEEHVQLNDMKQVLQGLVNADRNNRHKIAPYVENWLSKVEDIEAELQQLFKEEEINKKNQYCRYSLSKRAAKMRVVVVRLRDERQNFSILSYPPSPSQAKEIFTANIKGLQSRTKIIKEVIEEMKNDEFKRISICGMGGVGKTTMVKEVIKIAEVNKLFDKVAFAVVSQSVDYRRIQGDIAGMLGLKFENETLQGRASELLNRLKIDKVLIVLDDIWTELDFECIGIPSSIKDHKGCKILFTSRDKHLCDKMGSQKNFIIPTLSGDEAWELFREMAGRDICDKSNIHPIAKEVANECGGLPIAIVTIGKMLLNANKYTWEDVLNQLKISSITSLEMQDSAYLRIQLSYNFLDTKEQKDCLLLCCLFPEDFDIPIEVLMRHGLGLGLFKGVGNLLIARNRVHQLIDKLKSRFLLLNSEKEECVKMHDIVRDSIIRIASRGQHGGSIDIEGPKGGASNYKAISIMLDKSKKLDVGFNCSNYQLLQVETMEEETIPWPDNSFQGMCNLKVFSLQNLCIPKPSLLFRALHNIWTLRLENCELGDISIIGTELTKLEILSFVSSNIKQLPFEIGQLSSLKLLDLSGCNYLYKIHSKVLARLSRLEELYIGVKYFPWHQNNAILAELKLLSHQLRVFEIRVNKIRILPKDLVFENLERFWVYVGHSHGDVFQHGYVHSNILYIKAVDCNFINYNLLMKQLVKNCEILYLEEVKYLKNLNTIDDMDEREFSNLINLCVKSCNDLEFLIGKKSTIEFSNLIKLELNNLPNMIGFVEVMILDELNQSIPWVDELKGNEIVEGEIHSFGGKLFSCDWMQRFPKLEEIFITGCSSLNMVFDLQNYSDLVGQGNPLLFPQMREMKIDGLGKLRHVWGHVPHNVQGFKNLRSLTINKCGSLRYVFTPSIVRALTQLEKMGVFSCNSMEELVSTGIENNGGDDEKRQTKIVEFAKLVSIELAYLPRLMSFCSDSNFELVWPSLKELTIGGCDELNVIQIRKVIESAKQDNPVVSSNIDCSTPASNKGSTRFFRCCFGYANKSSIKASSPKDPSFLSSDETEISLCSPMPILQHIKIWHWNSVDAIFSHSMRMNVNSFCEVVSVDLRNVPNLVNFCRRAWDSPSLDNDNMITGASNEGEIRIRRVPFIDGLLLPNLTSLEIQRCHKINGLFSLSSSTSLECLKELKIINCDNIEEIVLGDKETQTSDIVFSGLRLLTLQDLRNFRSFCSNSHRLEFPSLEEVSISDCPKMEELLCGSSNTPKLQDGASNEGEIRIRRVPFIDGFLLPNLKSLEIQRYHKISSLFSLSSSTSLKCLKELDIRDCENIEEIVLGDKETQTSGIVFPGLRLLTLKRLRNLRSFCSNSHHLEFPSLEEVSISDCPKMEELLCGSSNTPKLQDVTIWGEPCTIKYMCKRDLNAIIRQCKALNVALQTSETLILFDEMHMFSHPKKLSVSNCISLVEVFGWEGILDLDTKKEYEIEEMELKNLPKLMYIWKSSIIKVASFTNLRKLRISACHNLTSVLPLSVAENFVHLEYLSVKMCNMIEKIVIQNDDETEGVNEKVKIKFPELKELYLRHLPNLRCFCSAAYDIELPSCHQMIIEECPNITTFSHGTVSTPKLPEIYLTVDYRFRPAATAHTRGDVNSTIHYIQNAGVFKEQMQESETFGWIERDEHLLGYITRVTELNLTSYENLLICVPSNMMHRFQHLEELHVKECVSVVEIFESKATNANNEEDGIMFYELQNMYLDSLPKLASIWKSYHGLILGFRNLYHLEVKSCHSLKSVFPLSIAKCLPRLGWLEVWDCQMIEENVAFTRDEDDKISQESNETEVLIFPNLWKLVLKDLPSLNRFCPGPCNFELPNCDEITIKNCKKMESFCHGITFTPCLYSLSVEETEYDPEEGLDAIIQRQYQTEGPTVEDALHEGRTGT